MNGHLRGLRVRWNGSYWLAAGDLASATRETAHSPTLPPSARPRHENSGLVLTSRRGRKLEDLTLTLFLVPAASGSERRFPFEAVASVVGLASSGPLVATSPSSVAGPACSGSDISRCIGARLPTAGLVAPV